MYLFSSAKKYSLKSSVITRYRSAEFIIIHNLILFDTRPLLNLFVNQSTKTYIVTHKQRFVQIYFLTFEGWKPEHLMSKTCSLNLGMQTRGINNISNLYVPQ
uniref:Uncharacterized protein n=1 Tax=Micrurus lemniscatus lemniscatus TaxID=129467 RepID=A0A2D4J8F9_MICLE